MNSIALAQREKKPPWAGIWTLTCRTGSQRVTNWALLCRCTASYCAGLKKSMFTSHDVHIYSLFLKKRVQYITIYVFNFSFPCCSVGFFLPMNGNILWRQICWWKTGGNFPHDFCPIQSYYFHVFWGGFKQVQYKEYIW